MNNFTLYAICAKLAMLWASLCFGADQAPRPPQAPPVQVAVAKVTMKAGCTCQLTGRCTCGESCPCALTAYEDGWKRAVRGNRPLVVWVGTAPCKECIPGAEHVVMHAFPGVNGRGIVVGVPDGQGSLDRVASLPHTSAMQDVAAVAQGKVAAGCTSCGVGGSSCSTGACGSGGGGCSSGSCGGSSRGFSFFRRR